MDAINKNTDCGKLHRSNDPDSSMNTFPGKKEKMEGKTLDQNKLIRHRKSFLKQAKLNYRV